MCGIAGYHGGFAPQILDRMNAEIAHRGPDGAGSMVLETANSRVGLTHRRLSIIDLSDAGRQPMRLQCAHCGQDHTEGSAGVWLTYNGEIYNYRELRAQLVREGHQFHSQTDSEVLLHLYVKHGEKMLEMLNGIFAFAIYDGRKEGTPAGRRPGDLLIARDGLGVKPFYYASLPDGVIFASELKALLASSVVPRQLDLASVHHSLAYLWTPSPRTVVEDVRKLPPGHAMWIRDARVLTEWKFYDIPVATEQLNLSDDAIADLLQSELRAAVDRQMVADVPVGAFLSGGLDSSSIVAMMKQLNPESRPRCYTIGFAGGIDADDNPADLPYAQLVAKHLDVDLQTIEIDSSAISNLERMLYFLDEPTADPAPITALLISERARADGVPVLLSGAGGDDILTGYRRHYALKLERYWSWLPRSMRQQLAAVARGDSNGSSLNGAKSRFRRAAKAFWYADLEGDERLVSYFWWSSEKTRRSLYSNEMAEAVGGVETAGPLLATLSDLPDDLEPLERMLYLEAKHFLADHNLNYTDKAGMAAGIEIRVPLLDQQFVEFCSRIPISSKQKGRVGKAIFKKAMEGQLPREVIYRPKTGFGVPLRTWLHTELHERLADTTSRETMKSRGIFDYQHVQRLIDQDKTGSVDATYTLFSVMCLELWCRIFIDGRSN